MVMSTPKRVPAGTPASGQFAPDQHTESGVSLPAGVSLSAVMTAVTAELSQRLNDCYDQRDDVNVHISRISAKLLAAQVAARYPDAATIVLDTTMSDGGNTAGVREVLDTEGTVLLDATDRLDTTVEEDDDLDEWDYTAGGIQLGRAHTEEFLDAPQWQQVGEGRILDNRHGRLNIDKALSLR
jgi:hypothetical protein